MRCQCQRLLQQPSWRGETRYRFHTWTYNVGGPVYIPGKFNKNKDKLFFFWSQEFWPRKTSGTFSRTMPTDLERNGDFSRSVDVSNRLIVIRDPNTNQPFPGNVIPQNRINPSSQALIKEKNAGYTNMPGWNTTWDQYFRTFKAGNKGVSGRYTRILSPTTSNEFHFGWFTNPESMLRSRRGHQVQPARHGGIHRRSALPRETR